MSKTGNVFMDALIKSGLIVEDTAFIEWTTSDEFKFPFKRGAGFNVHAIDKGLTNLYNCIRRASEKISMDWIKQRDADLTDSVLLTWMKLNTGIIRFVDEEQVSSFIQKKFEDMTKGNADPYELITDDYKSKLNMYIVHDVIRGKFVLYTNFHRVNKEMRKITELVDILKILNYISDHRDLIEFIPLFVDNGYTVSHKEYFKCGEVVPEVSVAYRGKDIVRCEPVMKRLSGWFEEGNKINPKNNYYILANKQARQNCYLRKAEG